MLAQNFMTADALGLTVEQHTALIKTLALMDSGKLTHVLAEDGGSWGTEFSGGFNMDVWATYSDCGTVACIGGTAELISGRPVHELFGLNHWKLPTQLRELFYPGLVCNNEDFDYKKITVAQAAVALRSYLTTGAADWESALE